MMATIATVAVVATTRRSHNVQGEVYIGLNYLASPKNRVENLVVAMIATMATMPTTTFEPPLRAS